jgi:phytoene synthase
MTALGRNLSQEVAGAYEHCRAITRRASRTFYFGSLLLPPPKRLAAWALYAFCRSVDDCADRPAPGTDPHALLDAWRRRIAAAFDGRASDPITLAWTHLLAIYPVPLQPALELIDGVQMDLDRVRPVTFEDLHLYAYRVAGTVGLLMAPILGYRSPDALPHAVDLGIAMQLTNILRDIGEDARSGRIYLPVEDLEAFGYSDAELAAGIVDDRFVALMLFQIARAQAYYERAWPGIFLLDASAQLAILASAQMYRRILRAIQANRFDVFTQRAHVPLASKLLMMPRLWLTSTQGHGSAREHNGSANTSWQAR